MKILHVASFDGNIGDSANHAGFYQYFKRYVAKESSFTPVEIRDFYKSWSLRTFDTQFVQEANRHDMLVFGGGSFWEPKWDYSATGTTIDLRDAILEAIKVPVLFNGIGVNTHKGTTPEALTRFTCFIQKILSSEQYFVSVRNDGSMDELKKICGEDLLGGVLKVPDGGYLIDPPGVNNPCIEPGKRHIGIVLGGDMPELRFGEGDNTLSRKGFTEAFSETCNRLLAEDNSLRLVFLPHIAMDLGFISDIVLRLNDKFTRTRVSIGPLLNGSATDGMYVFGMYRNFDLLLGMRHHASVCGIVAGVPTVGILNFGSHIADYHELGIPHRYVLANEKTFAGELETLIRDALANPDAYQSENYHIVSRMHEMGHKYMLKLQEWLGMS